MSCFIRWLMGLCSFGLDALKLAVHAGKSLAVVETRYCLVKILITHS